MNYSLVFPIHGFEPIRSEAEIGADRSGSVSQEVKIGSGSTDLRWQHWLSFRGLIWMCSHIAIIVIIKIIIAISVGINNHTQCRLSWENYNMASDLHVKQHDVTRHRDHQSKEMSFIDLIPRYPIIHEILPLSRWLHWCEALPWDRRWTQLLRLILPRDSNDVTHWYSTSNNAFDFYDARYRHAVLETKPYQITVIHPSSVVRFFIVHIHLFLTIIHYSLCQ